MTDTNRVKRWRDAKRDRGLKAVTVWLSQEEELRLKDIALQWHCSPSTVMQRALAQVTTNTLPYIGIPPDTSLIRELIRAELATMQAAQTPVTETVTVTETSESEAKLAREYVTVPGNRGVTETTPLAPVTDAGNHGVPDTGATDGPTTLAPAPEMPGPTVQTVPTLAEDIMTIAAARVQYDTMSERAFTQLLFDRGIYRHQAKDGSEVPLPHSTLRDWLQRARNAGVLEGRL